MAIDREKVLVAAQKFVEKKKYDKAVLEYQKIIAEDPNDARTLLKIGDLQSKMETYADAISTYERVGKHYASQGFSLKAIAVYKQIRELITKHQPQLEAQYAHITPKLAELYQQLGLTSDALLALDEVATRFQRQQRDAEAIEVFKKIVELDPTNPLPHLRLAEALSRVQNVDAAVSEFATAGSQLLRLGRRDDALKVLERLLHHKSDPAQARIAAELYLARGQQADGMQALSKLQLCFQANPRDLDTLALLARAFNVIGQAAKAIEVQKEMARIARDAGKNDVLVPLLRDLLKVAPHDEAVRKLAAASGLTSDAPQAYRQPAPSTAGPSVSQGARVDELSYEPVDTHDLIQDGSGIDHDAQQYLKSMPPEEEVVRQPQNTAYRPPYGSDGQLEVVEQEEAQIAPDVSEQLAQVLADAGSFRRVRLYAKAIATLKQGLELEPRSLEVREVLRDVLIEAGRTDEAVVEMLTMASLCIDTLDGEGAARMLQDVLTVSPGNYRAIEMLRELGYEYVDESVTEEAAPLQGVGVQTNVDGVPRYQGYAAEAPLPSYDLEEMGPDDVSNEYSEPPIIMSPQMAAVRARGVRGDFDAGPPLPAFPLETPEPEASTPFDLIQPSEPFAGEATELQQQAYTSDDSDNAYQAPYATISEQTGEAPPQGAELEEALEEADFFTSRGLYEDARTIITDQIALHPNNRLLREKLAEVEQQELSTKRGSGTRERPLEEPQSARGSLDRSFDIAASLGAIEDTQVPSFEQADKQVDVEEVFAKFKEGVAKQIGLDDGQSHYDLGVAYKEMGLVEDAIREFETSARDPKRECVCRSMIGMIQMERGNVNEAIDAFLRGLHAPHKSADQETVLSFEIGNAYEMKKMNREALSYFQKVMRREPNYRDVQERVRRLSTHASKGPPRQAAVGADDEFDRAFDDLIGKS